MSAPILRPTGQAAADTELLAQLGLPASASPEDVDQLHQTVSDFLSTAPAEIRGWARAQVAALDAAYITLTDPAGLEGSALMSPASPPVALEGPATPPAPRGPDSEATQVASEEEVPAKNDLADLDLDGEPDAEALAALYASVTPSAHEDMAPAKGAKPTKQERREARRQVAVPMAAATPTKPEPNIWKRIVLGGAAIIAIAAVAFGANTLVNGNAGGGGTAQASPAASGALSVDPAKVSSLMQKLQANPKDTTTLLALADEYYQVAQYDTAASWLDKLLAVEPENIQALLARGAVYFNLSDAANAEATWKKVVASDPKNTEVHYDLGFLYLNQPTPNWAGVQAEWNKVIELAPGSDLAKTVQSHLDSLAASSMIPGSSTAPGASSAPAPSSSPAASPTTAPAASPAASATP